MTEETVVATFASQGAAEDARRDLENIGIASDNIEIRARASYSGAPVADAHGTEPGHQRGFFAWLFGEEEDHPDLSSEDRTYYRSYLDEGRGAIMTVTADSSRWTQIEAILNRWHAQSTPDQSGVEAAPTGPSSGAAATGTAESATGSRTDVQEEVIPTAREDLKIGKRTVQDTQAYRVRRYVVERPVEEQIALRDETVTVERRVPGSAAAAAGQAFEEKIVEVTETREEPVVSKEVRAGEEIAVRKDVRDRVETVRDTVRESKVDVERAAAGDKPGIPGAKP